MFRLLRVCLALILLAAIVMVALEVLRTADLPVGSPWLAGGFPPARLDRGASPFRWRPSSWLMNRFASDIDRLRASLLPHDKIVAANGTDTSILFFTALATGDSGGQDFNYSRNGSGWRQKVFDINKRHCMRHGIPVVLRQARVVHSRTTLAACKKSRSPGRCVRRLDREAATWEKIRMMRDMLRLPGVSYAFSLDADAVFSHMEQDTMRWLARLLDDMPEKDLIFANEEWRNSGRAISNTGMMFVRNTAFTRQFFSDWARAFQEGSAYTGPGPPCQTNEQDCLASWKGAYPKLMKRLLNVNSTAFNFNPCAWFWCPDLFNISDRTGKCHSCRPRSLCPHLCGVGVSDPRIEIIHFMGDSRFFVDLVMPHLPQP